MATAPTNPEQNANVKADFAKIPEIDFVNQFGYSVRKLIEALSITRKVSMPIGTQLTRYKTTVALTASAAGENEVIPLSKATQVKDTPVELKLNKYRKLASVEAIQQSGFEVAVNDADRKLVQEIQKRVRKDLFDGLAKGTGSPTVTGTGLQGALATAFGFVQSVFEDDAAETIVFANPIDIATYLGTAGITTNSAFGMTYLEPFVGVRVFSNTSVPAGKIYATAPQNLIVAYAPVNGGEISKAFGGFTTEETGLIGVAHEQVNNTMSYETVSFDSVVFFAENLAGVATITITKP